MNAHIADPKALDALDEKNEAVSETEEELILRFKKPYSFEGQSYTEVDLSGLEEISAADLCRVAKFVKKETGADPIPEMSMPYAIQMAVRVTGKPIEFFQRLPAREAIKLKNLVAGFLYGGDGEE